MTETAQCIGCSCTDMKACQLEDGPCRWLRVDYEKGKGVCSGCPDHVARWDEGERENRLANESRTMQEQSPRRITFDEWQQEGRERFGKDMKQWRFVCPRCETVQSAQDFIDAGLNSDVVNTQLAFSCIGRHVSYKGCDWTLGGLFTIHNLEIVFPDGGVRPTFEFEGRV